MNVDVSILGGGLAGPTLALQLQKTCPELSIAVVERRKHPVPEAAHKVGESTVEIGAHYFEHVLGLGPHLKTEQIRKFGFRFFFSDGQEQLDQTLELGVRTAMPVPSYQIDRGIFENFLAKEVQRQGMHFIDSALIKTIDLSSQHVVYSKDGEEHSLRSRWVIDASGRAGLLKRKLGLAKDNAHKANAVWFRVKGKINIDAWSDSPVWRGRCSPPERWRSTNHLCGRGYWLWLIPLAGDAHSVGIVADAQTHPLVEMNSFDKAMNWIQKHQPRLFAELDGRRDALMDFAFFKHFSYSCTKVWDAEARWALTGEAGLFLDPFYSPGSDFIAMSNTFICDLIQRDMQDKQAQSVSLYGQIYERMYFSFYESTLTLYQDQYDLFGDPEVMPQKVLWDYTYYWGMLAPLYMHGKLTDLAFVSSLIKIFEQTKALNLAMQAFLRQWGGVSRKTSHAIMIDQKELPWFVALNRSLQSELDATGLKQLFADNHLLLNRLARQMLRRALSAYPMLDTAAVAEVMLPVDKEVDEYVDAGNDLIPPSIYPLMV
ncbi:MAG: hypothetical protein RLZZ502_1123 [Pseudomonadota bacterium]|jgi:flavin-dependent dehydrogenase